MSGRLSGLATFADSGCFIFKCEGCASIFMGKILFILLAFLTVAEALRWLFLYGRFAFFSTKKKAGAVLPERELPPISIIICARNEAENLAKNLPFILEQAYPDLEIIVVNDASTDGTQAVLAGFLSKNDRLRVVSIPEKKSPGKKAALTEGIRQAKNEWLLLTDADCRPASKFWAKTMAAHFFEKKSIVLGFGPYQKEAGFLNKWIRFEACWTALQYFSHALAGMPYMGVGRNLAYRKSLFEKAGGFEKHADLTSGDDDLFIAETADSGNVAVCLDPDSFVFSGAKSTWRGYFQQKKRHFTTGKRYPKVSKMALGVGALSHGLHYFLTLYLLFTEASMVFVLMCYLLRVSIVWIIWAFALRRFREGDIQPIVPVFDALIILFHALFSPVIFFSFNQSRSWT